ncbi:DoxX family protein [Peterkaempfera bronchialis]|uniref:DoxX family protein n=1 Tax=Peterkaempfera bronchialis TaxID=2126346 RepID=UPI003C2FA56B
MNSPLPQRWTHLTLGLFRVVVALLFTCHGIATLFGVLGGAQGGHAPALLEWPGWWASLIEFVGGILVAFGLFSRPAALLCSGSMAYAYFTVHQEHALMPIQNGGEAAAMFCWAFLAIAVLGPGAAALDNRLLRPRTGPDAAASPGATAPALSK